MEAVAIRDLLRGDNARIDGTEALRRSGALDGLKDALFDAMHELPPEYDDVPPRVLAVWLAELMVDGVKVVRDWQAGLGESEGLPVGVLGAGAGQTDPSNARRKLPYMREFAHAQRAADLTGGEVEVFAYGYRFLVQASQDSKTTNSD